MNSREKNQAIRDWANGNGHPVSERGRLPGPVVERLRLLTNPRGAKMACCRAARGHRCGFAAGRTRRGALGTLEKSIA
ncbi:Lsr2 family DNA-binding protein [Actinoplanes subtropicus]|uniref:Lsr2 family DNA-binding protein n=1 Tax=Actinoplanes subtropicus TaxID=543632 RepID=UPI003CCC11A6